MFNIDKILRRSLSKDINAMEEKYEYYIKIDNGMDFLHVYLTKQELKKLQKKDKFGEESLNIPDKKVQNLWNEYYKRQERKREENIKDAPFNNIPKVGEMEYIDFEEFLTVDEWMKVVNYEAVLVKENGKVSIAPIAVLGNFKIERLFNRTDIDDNTIYEVKIDDSYEFTPVSFKELKKYAKVMAQRLIIQDEHTDGYLQFITERELEQIKNKEITIYQTIDTFLLIAVDD